MYTVEPAGQYLSVKCDRIRGARLKEVVPQGHRWWNPQTYTWTVSPHMLDVLIDVLGPVLLPMDYEVFRLAYPSKQAKGFVPAPRHIPEKRYSKAVR